MKPTAAPARRKHKARITIFASIGSAIERVRGTANVLAGDAALTGSASVGFRIMGAPYLT
jgi:hypothetical protein